MKATCPECFFEFETDSGVILGEILSCEDCGAELEVIQINNKEVKLQIAESEEEDWGE